MRSHSIRTRDSNLDLLRATAILMVLVFHVFQRWPVPLPLVTAITTFGEYGVDLFFILSGWLIGSLFWKEQERFGDVEVGRFICRRALRTMPPYFIAFAASYMSARLTLGQHFDPRYLVFLQNYEFQIPFFLTSWSLCVEEHFYLAMPFIALLIFRLPRRFRGGVLLVAAIPLCCRAYYHAMAQNHGFGYYITATHFRFEGLVLGVWASYLCIHSPMGWSALRRLAPKALLPMFAAVLITALVAPSGLRYTLFYTLVAGFFLLLLITVVDRKPILFSDSKPVFWIASTSYSVYLTHAFALGQSLRLVTKLPAIGWLQCLVIFSAIAVAGAAFYFLVEVPSLALRARLMPGRTHERSPLLDAMSQLELGTASGEKV